MLLGGELQITVDSAGAFDAVPRKRLFEGTCNISLPTRVIDIVMQWRQHAQYTIKHDDSARLIDRQGCAVAPTLWLIYSHLISS